MKIETDVNKNIYDKAYHDGYMDALKNVADGANEFHRRGALCDITSCDFCFERGLECQIGCAVRKAKDNYGIKKWSMKNDL